MRTIIACVLLLGCSPRQLAAQNTLVAEIPVALTNKTTVTCTIGGAPLRLILDSGFDYDGALVFDAGKVDTSQFALVQARVPGAGAGAPSAALYDSAASFSCGTLRFQDTRLILMTSGIFKGYPNDGAIGHSILGHYAVELDYDRGVMRVYEPRTFSPGPGWTSLDLYFQDRSRVPWLDVRVVTDSEPAASLKTYIDYASAETLELLDADVNRYTRPKTAGEVVLGAGASGELRGYRGTVAKLMIGPFTLTDQKAVVVPAAVRAKQRVRPDAVLGNGAFMRFNVIFDYAHSKLHLKPRAVSREP